MYAARSFNLSQTFSDMNYLVSIHGFLESKINRLPSPSAFSRSAIRLVVRKY